MLTPDAHMRDAMLLLDWLHVDPEDTNVRSGYQACIELIKATGLTDLPALPSPPLRDPMRTERR